MGRDGVVTQHALSTDGSTPCMSKIELAIASADDVGHSPSGLGDLHSSHILNVGVGSNCTQLTPQLPLHIGTAGDEGRSHLSNSVSQTMRMRETEAEVTAHMQDELQAIRSDIQNLSSKVRADVRAELKRLHSQSSFFDHMDEPVASATPGASVVAPPPIRFQQSIKGSEPPLLFDNADNATPWVAPASLDCGSAGYPLSGKGASNGTILMAGSVINVPSATPSSISGLADTEVGETLLTPVVPSVGSERGNARLAAAKRAAAATKADDTAAVASKPHRDGTVGFAEPDEGPEEVDNYEPKRQSMASAASAPMPIKSRNIRKSMRQPKEDRKPLIEEINRENSLRGKLLILLNSAAFDYVSACLVLANALTIGLQTDYMAREVTEEVPAGFRAIDVFFCVAFTSELCFRMSALNCSFFYGDGWKWNVFDLILVILQFIDEVLSSIAMSLGFNFSFMRVLRILRLIRIIRIIRILRLIGELRTIVSSIMGSLKSLAWTVVLLFLLVYVFGVFFTQLVLDQRVAGLGNTVDDIALETYFSSLGRSILSLYQAISGGVDWDDLATPLMLKVSVVLGFVVAFYVAFALLALLNVVTGVFVEAALKSAKEDRDSYLLHHVKNLFVVADKDGGGTLDWNEFEGHLETEGMQEFFKSIDVDISEAKAVFHLLDVDDSGRIDLEEFLNGCLGLHGPAQAIHLATLMHETRLLARGYHAHTQKIEKTLTNITKSMSSILDSSREMRSSVNTTVDTELERKLGTLLRRVSQESVAAPVVARPLLTRQVVLWNIEDSKQPNAAVGHQSSTGSAPKDNTSFSRLPGVVYGSD